MKDKAKLLFSKIIYKKMELDIIEQEIINSNIKCKDVVNNDNYDIVSKYFFLMNDVNLNKLTEYEKFKLEDYISNIDFQNIVISSDLLNFLEEIMYKVLLPDTTEKYLSYYGTGYEYMAPSDSIVLGFHYIKYMNNDDYNIKLQNKIICEKMNYIQGVMGPSKQMKVSVLVFDESNLENNFNFFDKDKYTK